MLGTIYTCMDFFSARKKHSIQVLLTRMLCHAFMSLVHWGFFENRYYRFPAIKHQTIKSSLWNLTILNVYLKFCPLTQYSTKLMPKLVKKKKWQKYCITIVVREPPSFCRRSTEKKSNERMYYCFFFLFWIEKSALKNILMWNSNWLTSRNARTRIT